MIPLNILLVIYLGFINGMIHLQKTSGSRFQEEVFKVREVQETKPHTYLLKDLNGEEIKGSFYSFELV